MTIIIMVFNYASLSQNRSYVRATPANLLNKADKCIQLMGVFKKVCKGQ